MRTALVLLILAVAITLQTTVGRFFVGRMTIDMVLIAVVFVALSYGPVAGLLGGTAAGLAQDALSGGIIGIGGLANSIVGFFTGAIGAQFIVSSALPRFVMFFLATVVQTACFLGVYALLPDASATVVPYGKIALQALANAAVGLILFQAVEGLPGLLQRRRMGGSYGRRRV